MVNCFSTNRKLIQLVLIECSPMGFANSSDSHRNPGKYRYPFCRCSRGGSLRVKNLPGVTQLAGVGVAQAGLLVRLLSLSQGGPPNTGETPSKKLPAPKTKNKVAKLKVEKLESKIIKKSFPLIFLFWAECVLSLSVFPL